VVTAYRGAAPETFSVLVLGDVPDIARQWIEAHYSIVETAARASAVVFDPREKQPHALPCVACLPVLRDDDWFVADGAWSHCAVRADAYASNEATLLAALRFVLAEDRAARAVGPPRLTWLGPLGELFPPIPPIGASFRIREEGVHLGRAPDAHIQLRQGAHSDQNSVARRHAHLALVAHGVHVYDLKSTNGIYVRGVRVTDAVLEPADELAICGTLRLRLDGALPREP